MLLGLLGITCHLAAWAQGATQTFELHPGWNAVYLQVAPQSSECDNVFAGLPIERVVMWNGQSTRVQYITDPNQLVPDNPEWLFYFPPGQNASALSTLHAVLPEHTYLIKLSGKSNRSWVVTGEAALRSKRWVADSYNLSGFGVQEGSGPTFKSLLDPSSAHAGQPVYRLDASGTWVKVKHPESDHVRNGEAFWVYTKGSSDYQGPVRVTLEQGGQLDFGKGLAESVVRLKNETNANQTYTLTPRALNGLTPAPLSYFDFASQTWKALDSPVSFNAQSQEELDVRLAVRRTASGGGKKGKSASVGAYQSVLQVSDGSGVALGFAVKALPIDHTGLWVGTVAINAVSEHVSSKPFVNPTTTPTPFQFRVILHVDGTGQVRLLDHVAEVIRKDAATHAPLDPILITRDPLQADLTNGKDSSVIRRVSAPVFAMPMPTPTIGAALTGYEPGLDPSSNQALPTRTTSLDVTGGFPVPPSAGASTLLSCKIMLYRDDPLSPFFHRYHMDHDDKSGGKGIGTDTDASKNNINDFESYTVERTIHFKFQDTDPQSNGGSNPAGWGDTILGGDYDESIRGLMAETRRTTSSATETNTVQVKGTFRINHLSPIGTLNSP